MTLEMELGMSESEANSNGVRGTDQGTQMKSSTEDYPSWNGTNSCGFSGLAGGLRNWDGGFGAGNGYFYSASTDGWFPYSRMLPGYDTWVMRGNWGSLHHGFSVRCIKISE
jgi:uncharacterized protein (TIGR02145 family)